MSSRLREAVKLCSPYLYVGARKYECIQSRMQSVNAAYDALVVKVAL
jgi:hypothetical protein